MSKKQPAITLVCMTTDSSDFYSYAILHITPRSAKELLTLKPIWEQANAAKDRLYCLEWFDDRITYGESVIDNLAELQNEWEQVPANLATKKNLIDARYQVSVASLKACDSGIVFSAAPKNDNGYFETPELGWADLEQLAAGKCPFPMANTH